ncbi:acetyl-CoA carboxylase biotin carboxylase subunit [Clostridium cellulovorans]|uniref:Biotin carboxylase n=1 Tax=Clostridium cellulovorans (strain ATCC 35296 / DSM 3052 / OCM 3 / 743B) TaxID=573061 RepID=D9SME1_CLOC7|nr:acetyl-CoA carboxylase biotin carboxylase subunit [Clostridium cellulovorans]ADL53797.1 acetyl-CoA carboxylase, biotin carboxylase [Clostridium cellulovorans 743B]
MIKKVLIANRGEIAVRVIRACREMDIATVAVYSEADKDALHVKLADEAVCIGPATSRDSYLNIQNILSACILTEADAIHPGFGFLSENSRFAKMCEECNIKFIGPNYKAIDLMGNKARAREIMREAGVPIVPGYEGAIRDEEHALEIAKEIGFPVMVKAASGGGGKGIKIVYKEEDLASSYNTAKAESKANFGDDTMYIEKYIEKPKHIEIQILGDDYGNVVHLGERDCSVQRKNQKVIEEAPSTVLSEETRQIMGEIAKKAAKAVNYNSVGTIEFLYDINGNFYFMEMNTRIQVEHPITEMVTGIDLVKEQINVASGMAISFAQEDISIKGHSIECRINAEDPNENFRPCPGLIEEVNFPGGLGVRVDTAIYGGYKIPQFYDSMIGKLIVYGRNRDEAIRRMKRALAEFIVVGVVTNVDLHFSILNHEDFVNGSYNTLFLTDKLVNK